jgi:uncharacterized protein (DUF1810 family)
MMSDTYDLQRFIDAQEPLIDTVRAELAAGRKRSHWMWFIFPQLAGLGRSDMAQRYAISGLAEARAYLAHPVLGERLRECSELAAINESDDARAVFGEPDDLKFHSSMTLFAQAAPDEPVFQTCLEKYFKGEPDEATLSILAILVSVESLQDGLPEG